MVLAGCPADKPSPPATPDPADWEGPAAPTTPGAPASAREALEQVVEAHCLDPGQPWALAHGVLVRGKELKLADGRSAVDALVVDNVVPKTLLFPSNRGATPIDSHPGLLLKVLVEVGVAPNRSFTAGGRTFSFAQLLEAGRDAALAGVRGETPAFKNRAWQLEILGESAEADLRQEVLEVLVKNQAYFEDYAREPGKRYRKATEQQGKRRVPGAIHRYYCGGLHLFQATQRIHGQELPPALKRQYELLLLRLKLETGYWKEAWASVQRRSPPDLDRHRRVIFAQRLKLQGHALETYLRAIRAGVLKAEPAVVDELNVGFQALGETVQELVSSGIYAQLPRLAKAAPQLYRDLAGDSAHALHAYVLAQGVEGVVAK